MNIKKFVAAALACVAFGASTAWGQTYTCSNGKSQQMGSAGGYDYELWSQNGAGSATMTLNPSTANGGAFSVEWSGTINMLARSGKRWGANSTVTVQNVGNITSEFEVTWSSTDNVKYVSVYGWGYYDKQDIPSGFSNEIEYYIIQDRGSYNPTQGGKPFGSATIDGIEYNFFTTDRIQQPSLSGTSTFKQYWSIPKNISQHRTKGTISISKHFEAWAKAGMKMGKLYEVASMKIESYTGSGGNARGSATVKKNLLTIGGPVNPDEFALTTNVSPAGAGTVTKSPSNTSYAKNASVQLTATPATGYKFVGWSGDATGATSPTSVTMTKDLTVTAKFELVSGDGTTNLLKDGNFPSSSVIADDGASWKLGQGTNWGSSVATSSVVGGTASINVTTIGTEAYQPQLVQYGLALDSGMKYKLTFKAKADVARKIEASFQQAVDPWGGYASKEFDLTTTEQTFEYVFEMTKASDPESQFAFNLGQATGNVSISDVKLVHTTTSSISASRGVSAPLISVVGGTLNVSSVAGSKLQVTVVDVHGKVKADFNTAGTAVNAKNGQYSVPLPKVKAGIYFVKVQSAGQSYASKILVH